MRDIDQSYRMNEVALVIDAAEVFDWAGFAVARWAHLTRPAQLGQLSGQSCSLA